jgi:hypothetical protein
VASSPSVGVFTSSAVAFSRRVAGAASALSANFTVARVLAAGETVTLSLPSFFAPAGAADPLVLECPPPPLPTLVLRGHAASLTPY